MNHVSVMIESHLAFESHSTPLRRRKGMESWLSHRARWKTVPVALALAAMILQSMDISNPCHKAGFRMF